jgi:excisionase family DNA binding protein
MGASTHITEEAIMPDNDTNERTLSDVAKALGYSIDPLTVSLPEYGSALGVSSATTYRLAYAGEIPVIRIGKQRRVPFPFLLKKYAQALEAGEALLRAPETAA